MKFDDIVELVRRERIRQDTKWGRHYHHPDTWLRIATEEMGEIASLIDDVYESGIIDATEITAERVQLAAVVFAWLESDSWELNERSE